VRVKVGVFVGSAVNVRVKVGVNVRVNVGVLVGSGVNVRVGVLLGVNVRVGVFVLVGVLLGVKVRVGVGVRVTQTSSSLIMHGGGGVPGAARMTVGSGVAVKSGVRVGRAASPTMNWSTLTCIPRLAARFFPVTRTVSVCALSAVMG